MVDTQILAHAQYVLKKEDSSTWPCPKIIAVNKEDSISSPHGTHIRSEEKRDLKKS